MTQTNTTQNKEELERAINKCARESSDGIFVYRYIKNYYEKAISQAHQSGIEEERKRITRGIKMIPYNQMPDESMRRYILALVDIKSLKGNKQ